MEIFFAHFLPVPSQQRVRCEHSCQLKAPRSDRTLLFSATSVQQRSPPDRKRSQTLRLYTINFLGADWLATKKDDSFINLQLAYKAWLLESGACESERTAQVLARALIPNDMVELIELGAQGLAACTEAAAYAAASPGVTDWRLPASSVTVDAPVKSPKKLLCIGLNYREHARETGAAIPVEPVFFNKFANSITGPDGVIELTPMTNKLDYEIELGVVIGRRARNVTVASSEKYIYGYTVVNDVSARDLQHSDGQWVKGKALDTYAPMGPCLVTRDEVEHPDRLNLVLSVNGEVRQQSNTEEMIFSIGELIAYLSSLMTLEPGDVIATGTPSGIGSRYNPPRFLGHGDVVRAEIECIGVIENRVAATSP